MVSGLFLKKLTPTFSFLPLPWAGMRPLWQELGKPYWTTGWKPRAEDCRAVRGDGRRRRHSCLHSSPPLWSRLCPGFHLYPAVGRLAPPCGCSRRCTYLVSSLYYTIAWLTAAVGGPLVSSSRHRSLSSRTSLSSFHLNSPQAFP